MGTTTVKVDTVPPEVTLNVTGTAGNHGWYKSPIQVVANPLDATSGVATFEVAVDGGGYQAYTTPLSFTNDARHTLQFRTMDNAGNLFESPVQNFYIDTIPPTVNLRGSWELGRNVPYDVIDEGSGLDALRIVIEDEDEKYAKVAWDEDHVSGRSYSQDIDWNGQFKDKTVAPPGTYLVWIKARDVAGNEHFELGKVIVPEPNYVGAVVLPTEDASVVVVPPAELSQPEETASLGASPEGTKTTTTTHSFTLTSGAAGGTTSSSAATSSSGVLWGAAAAAVISAATTYALETTRKRKEAEEAQAAAVRAEVAKDKAKRAEKGLTKEEKKELKAEQSRAHDAKVQERKEREEQGNLSAEERAQLKWEEERDAAYAQQVYQNWLVQQELEKRQKQQEQLQNSTPPGIPLHAQSVNLHGDTIIPPLADQRIAEKMTKFEAQEDAKWVAAQTTIQQAGLKVQARVALDDDPPGFFEWAWNGIKRFIFGSDEPATPKLGEDQIMQTAVANAGSTLIAQQATQTAQATPTFIPTLTPTLTLVPTPSQDKMWVTFPANLRPDPSFNNNPSGLLGVYSEVLFTGQRQTATDPSNGQLVTFNQVVAPNGERGWAASNFLESTNQSNIGRSLSIDPAKNVLIDPRFKPSSPSLAQDLNIGYQIDPVTGKAVLIRSSGTNFNLCGEFAGAYTTGRSIETLITDWVNQDNSSLQARARQVIDDPIKQLVGYGDLQNMLDMYECSYQDFLTPFQEPVSNGYLVTPGRLKAVIDQGNSLIVGVNVNQGTGALNQGSTDHWVVLDDVLPQGVNAGQVLVYNPMPNTQEIYPYDTFLKATSNFNTDAAAAVETPNNIRITGIWVDLGSCK
jgi:hypothetical protein